MPTTVNVLGARPSRPREKVYGKRRHGPLQNRDANLRLFAGIATDDIEKGIASLSVAEKSEQVIERSGQAVLPTIANTRQNGASGISSKSDKQETSTRKTSPRRRDRLKKASLSEEEAATLEPVLAFERIDSTVQDFGSWSSRLSNRYDISKLSEGSYSDCFLCARPPPEEAQVVLKIIPFKCTPDQENDIATDAQGFLREVKVLTALEPYHGFAQIHSSFVVKGRMAPNLVAAARSWLETTTEDADKSIDPATKYAEDQLFGVIEMEYAGRDLELLVKSSASAFQAFDAFWMTAILIANAENSIEFEHRDLHMSNICFKKGLTGQDDVSADFVKGMTELPSTLLGLSGLAINIIDYTHSRMTGVDERVLYNPDPAFTSTDLEKFGTERLPCDQMDTVIKAERWMSQRANQQKESVPKYAAFTPKTNVIWLSHVLNQLIGHAMKDPRRTYIKGSSAQARSLQASIWKRLKGVLAMIDSDNLDSLPNRTEELIKMAVEAELISQGDVDAFTEWLNRDSSP